MNANSARNLFRPWILAVPFLAWGCSKATPDVQSLGSLTGFAVNQSSVAGTDFEITGDCSSQFSAMQVSVDNGQTWTTAQTYSANLALSCGAGHFRGEFQFAAHTPSFLIRGVGALGTSPAYLVAITALIPRTGDNVSGGTARAQNASFKVSGSLRQDTHYQVLANANLKVKGTLLNP